MAVSALRRHELITRASATFIEISCVVLPAGALVDALVREHASK